MGKESIIFFKGDTNFTDLHEHDIFKILQILI